ncbi:MAG: head-tail connector protein [Alsobacter sp.]
MALVLLAAPAAEPVTLAEAKAWLRVDAADDDATIGTLITAARQWLEARLRIMLISQRWRWILDAWPPGPILQPPAGPLRSVEAMRVYSAGSVASALATSAWQADTASLRGRIALQGPLPSPGRPLNGVEIDLTVGLAATAADLPAPLKEAVLQTVAFLYENRGDAPDPTLALPAAVEALAFPWRVRRL